MTTHSAFLALLCGETAERFLHTKEPVKRISNDFLYTYWMMNYENTKWVCDMRSTTIYTRPRYNLRWRTKKREGIKTHRYHCHTNTAAQSSYYHRSKARFTQWNLISETKRVHELVIRDHHKYMHTDFVDIPCLLAPRIQYMDVYPRVYIGPVLNNTTRLTGDSDHERGYVCYAVVFKPCSGLTRLCVG